MKTRNVIVTALALSLLAGCSLIPGRQPVDYKGAAPAPALEVPPDLTQPGVGQRYAIPAADGTQVANYSDYSREVCNAEQPAAAPTPAAATTPVAALMTVGNERFVLLTEPFDRAWRKAGLALERAGLKASDVDRSKGVYFLEASGKQPAELRVRVQESSGVSAISVVAETSAQAGEAARILDLLYQNLEK